MKLSREIGYCNFRECGTFLNQSVSNDGYASASWSVLCGLWVSEIIT